MVLGAEVPPEVATWGAGLLVSGAVGLFVFFGKRAFEAIEKGLETLAHDVKTLVVSHHATGTALALLQQQVAELKLETAYNRQRLHDLKDQWGPVLTRATMVGEQMKECERKLEKLERDLSEGVVR